MRYSSAALIYFTVAASLVQALPKSHHVTAGSADFCHPDEKSLVITTSDKAVINFPSYHIAEHERVEYVQPGSRSCVLNRIEGQDPSYILGNLKANGKIFFVNPNGVFFGPKATVSVGTLVASTLDILDQDFMREKYNFFQRPGTHNASLINQGSLNASPEGAIILLAPHVRNEGAIVAKAGKVVLAGGEKVVLDFSGDGLVSFSVENAAKEAVIEHLGSIQAPEGEVFLRIKTADHLIKSIVNTDGAQEGSHLIAENGVIKIVSHSEIAARKVSVEGEKVEVAGQISASTFGSDEKGGEVEILGDRLQLTGAEINASGDAGGGNIFIGGDYQGHGERRNAKRVTVDTDSVLTADARENGKGGTVIVWADERTVFDGKIFARGGAQGGDGGFVETSGYLDLAVLDHAQINTFAPCGNFGQWLLDPTTINVTNAGVDTAAQAADCADANPRTVTPTALNASIANPIILCASSSITITNDPALTAAGKGLTMTAPSGGNIPINLNTNVTTAGGPIVINGTTITLGAACTISTTGSAATGAPVTVAGTVNGTQNFSVTAGTGAASFTGVIGGSTAVSALSITANGGITLSGIGGGAAGAAAVTLSTTSGMTLNGGTYNATSHSYTGDVTLGANTTITAAAGSAISITGSIDSDGTTRNLTLDTGNTGAGNIAVQAIGLQASIGTLVVGNAGLGSTGVSSIKGSFVTTGTQTFNQNVSLTGDTSLTGGSTITFAGTVNGTFGLAINTASTTAFQKSVGNSVSVGDLRVTNGPLALAVLDTGAITLTSAGQIRIQNSVTLNDGVTITGTNDVAINGSILGGGGNARNLTITSTSGAVDIGNTIGSGGTLGAVSFTAGDAIQFANIGSGGTVGAVTLTGSGSQFRAITCNAGTMTATSFDLRGPFLMASNTTVTASAGDITFRGTADTVGTTPINLSLTTSAGAGNITVSGAMGTQNPLGTLTVNAGATHSVTLTGVGGTVAGATTTSLTGGTGITLNGGNYKTGGAFTVNTSGVTLGTNVNIITTAGNINFSGAASTINGAFNLGLNSAGTLTFGGTVGGGTPLKALTIDGATSVTAGAINSASFEETTSTGANTFSSTITTTGPGGVALNGSTISLAGAVTTSGTDSTIEIANSGQLSINTATISAGESFTQSGAGAVVLQTNAAISTSAGDITFGSDVSGTVAGAQALSFSAGTGNITLTTLGGTTRLGAVTISSVGDFDALGITSTTLTQSAGTGLSKFEGAIDLSGTGTALNLTGNAFTISQPVTTVSNASVSISNTDLLTTPSTTSFSLTGTGTFTQAGGGAVSTGANVTTVGQAISYSGAVGLTNPVSLSTGVSAGSITFSKTIDGTQNLTLNTGGALSITGAVGSATRLSTLTISKANGVTTSGIKAASISESAATGANVFNGTLDTNGASGITLNGTTVAFNGPVTTTGGGPLSITASTSATFSGGNYSIGGTLTASSSPVILGANTIITTTTGNINFSGATSTINGAFNLTLNSAGTLTFGGIVGGTTPPKEIIIDGATSVTATAISAGSFEETTSTGANTFSSTITTTGPGGIALNGSTISLAGAVTTSGTGSTIDIANSGQLSINTGTISAGGSFTQSGAGAVVLGTNAAISTSAGNITLGSDVSGTVAGAQALSFSAGTGNISLTTLGGTTRLGPVTISSVGDLDTLGITSTTLTQSAGTGLSNFAGAIDLSGTGTALNLTGKSITISQPVTTVSNASVSISNTGLLTTPSTTSFSLTGTGSFTQAGGGAVSTGANITTVGQAISYSGAVGLTNTVTLSTGVSAGSISFSKTIDGTQNLTLNTGGALSITGAVGSATRLSALTISKANGVTTDGIKAASISESAATGANSFGLLDTTGAITLNGAAITLNDSVTAGGNVSITNSGVLTITSDADIVLSGTATFTQVNSGGTGTVSTAGSITTNNALIQFASPITLTGPVTFDTGPGIGNLVFSSTIDGTVSGAQDLTLAAGTGSVTLSGAVGGVRLGALKISSANGVSAGAITAASISEPASTGANTFGALNTNGAIGIALSGSTVNLTGTVTTTGSGPVAITNTGLLTISSAISADGAFSQTGGGAVSLGAGITTTNDPISFTNGVTLATSVALTNGGGSGDISFASTLTGTNPATENLTLTAGTGNVVFTGAVGATRLGDISIVSAGNVTASSTITAKSLTQTAGTGLSAFSGAISLSGTGNALNLAGNSFTISSPVTMVNPNASVLINNTGLLTTPASASPFTLSGTGSFTQLGGGSVSTGANITTASQAISYSGAVTLTGTTVSLDTTGGGGSITFSKTIDSTNGTQNLTLNTGGAVSITGDVGSVTRLSGFTISNATGVTTGGIKAASIGSTSTGTSSFGALDTNTLTGITLSGDTVNLNGTVTTTTGGPVSITNTPGTLTIAAGADMILTGAFTQSGGSVSTAGNITTTNQAIQFVGGVTLTGPVTFNAGNANIVFSNSINGATQALTLSAGSGSVTVTNGMGGGGRMGPITINSTGTVSTGTIIASSISKTGSSGTGTYGILNTNGILGIAIAGGAINLSNVTTTGSGPVAITNTGLLTIAGAINANGPFSQAGGGTTSLGANVTSTGGRSISFANDVTLATTVALSNNGGTGNISFGSQLLGTTNVTENLTLTAATGNISFTGAVGTTPIHLGNITIASAGNVTASSTLKANSLTQSAGTGISTFTGAIDLSAQNATSLSLTGAAFTIGNPVTTALNASILINNTGLLTTPSTASPFTLQGTGTFNQSGTGPVSTGANVTTAGGAITYTGGVSLTAPVSLDTTAGAGSITFSRTIDGTQTLTLNTGGALSITGAVGSVSRLNTLTITNAAGVTTDGIKAASIIESNPTGANSFGTLDTTGAITLKTSTLALNDTVTAGGNVSITNTGALNIASDADMTITGSFTQSGGGSVSTAGSITTTNNPIQFANQITLTGPVVFNAGNGNLVFSSTIDGTVSGAQDLTLTSGTQSITLSQPIGGGIRLGAVTLNSTGTVSAGAITAASINKTGSAGTDTYGALDTNGANGIALHGGTITLAAVTTTNEGSVTLVNTGPLTFNANVTSDGSITQSGGGTNILGASTTFKTTSGGNVSFVNVVDATTSGVENLDVETTGGNGNITFSAALGATTRLGTITFGALNPIGNLTASGGSISAVSITQTDGTGISTFSGGIDLSGTGTALNLKGNGFTISQPVTTVSNASVAIDNSGLLTIPSTSGFNLSGTGSFTQGATGGGAVSMGSNVSTANQPITFNGDVTLNNTVSLNTAGGAGDITFAKTIDGTQILNLTAGTGAVSITGDVGSVTRLGAFTIESANGVTTSGIKAASISETLSTGANSLGALDTTGDITLTTTTLALNDTVTAGGNVAIVNSAGATIAADADMTITGSFTQSGGGSVSTAGSITTTNHPIQFANAINLTGPVAFNAGNGNLVFSDTINGGQSLSLTAGTGSVTFGGAVGGGTRLGALTINNANGVSAGAITAAAINELGSTGANTLGALNTNASVGVILNGSTVNLTSTVTTTNAGPVAITNTGLLTISSAISSDGTFSQTGGGSTNLNANITTSNDFLTFDDPINLGVGTITLNSGAGAGNISLGSTVDGARALILTAGTGQAILNGAVGSTTPPLSLAATAALIDQNSSVVTVGTVTYTGNANVGGSITTTNSAISISGDVVRDTTNNVTLSSTGGTITLSGKVDGDTSGRNLTITPGAGNAAVNGIIGSQVALNNFTVTGTDITLAGMGKGTSGVTGTTTGNATGTLTFSGSAYIANNQTWTAGTLFNLTSGSPINFTSNSGPMTFNTAEVFLADPGTALVLTTANSALTFVGITGASLHSIFIHTGSGTANMGFIGSPGPASEVLSLAVDSGSILLSDVIETNSLNMRSTGSILNTGVAQTVTIRDSGVFNALGGSVGTPASPIDVESTAIVIAGATTTASFNGMTGLLGVDNDTIYCLPTNPPPVLTFNGVVINCGVTPPPPPGPTPTPVIIIPAVAGIAFFNHAFATATFSVDDNPATDFYMLPDFALERDTLPLPNLLFYKK